MTHQRAKWLSHWEHQVSTAGTKKISSTSTANYFSLSNSMTRLDNMLHDSFSLSSSFELTRTINRYLSHIFTFERAPSTWPANELISRQKRRQKSVSPTRDTSDIWHLFTADLTCSELSHTLLQDTTKWSSSCLSLYLLDLTAWRTGDDEEQYHQRIGGQVESTKRLRVHQKRTQVNTCDPIAHREKEKKRQAPLSSQLQSLRLIQPSITRITPSIWLDCAPLTLSVLLDRQLSLAYTVVVSSLAFLPLAAGSLACLSRSLALSLSLLLSPSARASTWPPAAAGKQSACSFIACSLRA